MLGCGLRLRGDCGEEFTYLALVRCGFATGNYFEFGFLVFGGRIDYRFVIFCRCGESNQFFYGVALKIEDAQPTRDRGEALCDYLRAVVEHNVGALQECAVFGSPVVGASGAAGRDKTEAANELGLIFVCSDVNHAARGDRFDEVGELIGNDRCGGAKNLSLSGGGVSLELGGVEGDPNFLIRGRTHELARAEA